ncbi:hypothetical protein BH10BAC5_BH10BAC5_18610 [soil metagenome]
MRNYFKFIFAILFFAAFILSCGRLKNKFEQMTKEDEDPVVKQTGEKEKTLSSSTSSDLKFFNKYIEISNNISEKVENINKAYYSEIPDPTKLKTGTLLFVISFGIHVNALEGIIKQYKRSLFDGGELAKLNADDKALKTTLETDFKNLLTRLYELHDLCAEIDNYYKNKEFKTNLSKARTYDISYKEKYKLYEESYKALKKDMKTLKPVFKRKDPENIKDPDEKVVVMMQNGYEDIIDKSDDMYEKLEMIKPGSDIKDLNSSFTELNNSFEDFNNKIESAKFSDKTKYIKYSFEDYFSKMFRTFSKKMTDFITLSKSGKLKGKEFTNKYDEVLSAYNNVISSYNSSINTINSIQVTTYE